MHPIIKEAIRYNNTISFLYYYSKGESERLIEPYFIVFKWSAWYVFGYCIQRQDFRLFKLNRLWELSCTNQKFEQRIIPQEKADLDRCFLDEFQVTILFDESVKYRLIDEYGVGCYLLQITVSFYFSWVLQTKNILLVGFWDLAIKRRCYHRKN